jgi:hypothetical protein
MRSPMLGSSDFSIMGENRCLKKWVNETEGPKIVPMKHGKGLSLH